MREGQAGVDNDVGDKKAAVVSCSVCMYSIVFATSRPLKCMDKDTKCVFVNSND